MRTAVTAALTLVLLAAGAASASSGRGKLPIETLRGPADRLEQYPKLSLASTAERREAGKLLARLRASTARWQRVSAAEADGFSVRLRKRPAGDRSLGILHAEHRRFSADRSDLDPKRPETLVYANEPGRPLVLIGVMFSVARGKHGPTPGGAITRWHRHSVCVQGRKRGLAPGPDGACPRGSTRRLGSEMLHVWFTHDLRSAFAIHAPKPELCRAGLLRSGCGRKLLCELRPPRPGG